MWCETVTSLVCLSCLGPVREMSFIDVCANLHKNFWERSVNLVQEVLIFCFLSDFESNKYAINDIWVYCYLTENSKVILYLGIGERHSQRNFELFILPEVFWGIIDITLYSFQFYNIMIWYLYLMQNDHHGKFSYHPSPHIVRIVCFMMRTSEIYCF